MEIYRPNLAFESTQESILGNEQSTELPDKKGEGSKDDNELFEKLDRRLRDSKSILSRLCEWISPERGEEYLNSRLKRFLDLSIAVPAAVVATPILMVAGLAKRLEDGGSAFFIQERYKTIPTDEREAEMFKIWKVRSMQPDAERADVAKAVTGRKEVDDPRVTRLGAVMRKYKIDELPQLWQAVQGSLSLVGSRPTHESAVRFLEEGQKGELFEVPPLDEQSLNKWKASYNDNPKSIASLAAVRNSGRKIEKEVVKYDVFYSKNANLGLDLYILWLTFARMAHLYSGRESRLAMRSAQDASDTEN